MIRHEYKPVVKVEYSELEDAARMFYDLGIEIAAELESDNGVVHDLGEFFVLSESGYDTLMNAREPNVVYGLVQALVNDNHLPEGNVMVEVYW